MKYLLTVVCAVFVGAYICSCGSKGTTESKAETEKATVEEVADEGNPEAKQAINDAEALLDWMIDLDKKDKEGKLSDQEKLNALSELLQKDNDWDEKYKKLKEDDYTPEQWKRLQELKDKMKEFINVSVK